jgi:class 3 adenylate cyclase/tetratricopeptide (TPR) repeat protein
VEQPEQQQPLLERRIVSVLFADLVGFTSLSESLDAEDVATVQDAYFAAVRETVGRYGGRLEKFIGDAAMAVFGAQRVRDDDAERSVRAGVALVHAVHQIGSRLGLDEQALRLRVGINTGEAVIAGGGPDEGRVTGDTVNTAARLQTAAPPGGVLIGDTTALAVADVVELEAVAPLELKGKAEPVSARLVSGFRPEPSREEAMGALRAPTLGRARELAALEQAHRRAAGGGVERWLIVAPPGVGKSRLLRELDTRLAGRGAGPATVVWRARARPDSLSPFEPIAGLMIEAVGSAMAARRSLDQLLAEADEIIGSRLADASVPELRARVIRDACMSLLRPAKQQPEARPATEREQLFEAWLDGLDALAAGATAVWLVEDVHWTGGDVLAFLDLAGSRQPSIGQATAAGRLVIATARPSLLDTQGDWAADDPAGDRHVIHLQTLDPTDARSLVGALVGDALPADLVERIADRSDGNCLFIEELLRTWVSVGTLVPADGGWRLAVAADEIPLPASVQSIYAAQLDDLPPAARLVARRASVAGRRFPLNALEPLGAGNGEGLEPLRRRELVVGPLTEPVWGEAFAYRHALLRDAGYASLARAERARLHVRLARWLEQAAGERSAEIADQIAGHYGAALESAPALAREIDDGLDREALQQLAARWYERAGRDTFSVAAHEAARQLFRRAIDLTPDEAPLDKARRWELLGDATAFAADMDEGAAAYEKAIELYRQAMTVASRAFDSGTHMMNRAADKMAAGSAALERRLTALGDALEVAGLGEAASGLDEGAAALRGGAQEIEAGRREVEDALRSAQSGLARSSASLADVMYQQLRFADSRELAERVMSEVGDLDPAATARLLIARARGGLGAEGPSADKEAELERAVELAAASGDARLNAEAEHALTLIRAESGRAGAAEWHRVAELSRAAGDWAGAIGATINAVMGDLDDHAPSTYAPIAEARALAVARGRTEDAGWTNYVEAEAAFISGDWERAMAAGSTAMDIGEQNAYRRLTVRTVHVVVPVAAVRGDRGTLERAAAFYASLIGKFEFPDSPYSRVIRTAQDLELAAAGLVPAYVPEVEPRLVSFADDPGGGSWSAALDRVFRSWIEAGELDGAARALAALEEALPRYANVSSLGRGTHQLLRARLTAARGEQDQAASAGRAALDHFRQSSAPWWMAKAIRLLERSAGAGDELIGEVEQIESRLGALGPTA